jgi:predicted regulator of Ras-like GTPase activity (Roadblock/LC7/MglB family)
MSKRDLELSTQQLAEIHRCLRDLCLEARARYVVLADVTGQLIEVEGGEKQVEPTALAALAAAELSATKELARLLGEAPHFDLLLHEGRQHNLYLSAVGEELVLLALYDHSTPLGMVRLFTRMTAERLQRILRLKGENSGGEPSSEEQIDDRFIALLSAEMDLSFGKN